MRRIHILLAPWLCLLVGLSGCHHPSITAVSLDHYCDHKWAFLYDPCKDKEGIPFYLPKPLLIVAKNFRNIEETKVGLTQGAPIPNFFDDQAKYADLNARTNFNGLNGTNGTGSTDVSPNETFPTGTTASELATSAPANIYSSNGAPLSPGNAPSDGLKPETFYTYHIVFVPDMTQKFALKINGGVGEIRAAMNLVNGWQFTGLGPYYMKDSSTAQNTLASGITANLAASGVADVVSAVANIKPPAGQVAKPDVAPPPGGANTPAPLPVDATRVQAVHNLMRSLNPKTLTLTGFAEISIYEPYIAPEGTMEWRLITKQSFDRDHLSISASVDEVMAMLKAATTTSGAAPAAGNGNTGAAAQGPSGQAQASGGNAQGAGLGGGGTAVPPATTPPTPAADPEGAGLPPAQGGGSAGAAKGHAGAAEPAPAAVDPAQNPQTPVDKSGSPPAPAASPGSAARSPRSGSPATRSPISRGNNAPPPLQGPKVSSTTRSRIPPPLEMAGAGPKSDASLVRSQMQAPAFLDAHLAASALAQTDGASTTFLTLDPLVQSSGDSLTSRSPQPSIDVHNAPPNTTLTLFRDQVPVNSITTGSIPIGTVLPIPDSGGVPAPGSYTYQVVQSEPNQQPVVFGPLKITVLTGNNQAGANPSGAVTPTGRTNNATTGTGNNTATPPATNGTAVAPGTLTSQASNAVLNQFLGQFGSVASATSAKANTAPVAAPVTPVVPVTTATPGNTVTLNQFFGKVKTAPASTAAPRRFSLFHQKDNKTIKTVALNGIESQALVAAAPTVPTVPTLPAGGTAAPASSLPSP